MIRAMLLLAVLAPLPALAQTCRNESAETRCGRDGCATETASFTPMSLTLAPRSIQICAYSGCASGPVTLRRTRGGLALIHANVRWRGVDGPGAPEPIAVIHDRAGRTASMRWRGFSQAMACR